MRSYSVRFPMCSIKTERSWIQIIGEWILAACCWTFTLTIAAGIGLILGALIISPQLIFHS